MLFPKNQHTCLIDQHSLLLPYTGYHGCKGKIIWKHRQRGRQHRIPSTCALELEKRIVIRDTRVGTQGESFKRNPANFSAFGRMEMRKNGSVYTGCFTALERAAWRARGILKLFETRGNISV